jgi:hypothetical protein
MALELKTILWAVTYGIAFALWRDKMLYKSIQEVTSVCNLKKNQLNQS